MVTQGRAPKAALRAAGYGIVLIAVALAAGVVISPAVVAAGSAALAAITDARGWARARTAHFDLLSDGGEAAARPAAAALARFQRVMRELLPAPRPEAEGPLVVLAFTSEDAFRACVPRRGAEPRAVDGFFQGGTARRFIAVNLRAERADPYDALYHEYAHLALNRSLSAQPAWVAEGLAELYSAWAPAGADARVGLARPEHIALLRRRGLLPIADILRADYTSDFYIHEERSDLFYAQSWLLAHYLVVSRPSGPGELRDYLAAITRGTETIAAFREAFGADPVSLISRLRWYVESPELPAARVPLPPADQTDPREVAAEAAAPSPGEVDYLIADLLLHQDRPHEARRRLQRSLAAEPGFVPAREGLAAVALRQARWDEARSLLGAALERSPDDPVALYGYADALVTEASRRGEVLSDGDTGAAVAALEKAVRQAPHFADAALLLARLRPQPARQRIALLEPAFSREPERTDIGIALSGLYVRVNDMRRAAMVLARARAAARDADMRFLAGHLLGRIGFAAAATGEVTGTLVRLECLEGGALDFVVDAEGTLLTLRAPGPRSVMLYGPDGEPREQELVCGPHHSPVSAFYVRADGADGGTAGTLLSMSWKEAGSE
jgi:tetratricopeptide (TPR) repeat protein